MIFQNIDCIDLDKGKMKPMKIKLKFYLYFILAVLLPILVIYALQYSLVIVFGLSGLFILLFYFVYKDFLAPLDDINKQIVNYQKQHNIFRKNNSFAAVSTAIDHLLNENQYLYDDMELVLNKQVERLSKKTASLEILYGVSEKLNKVANKKQLFQQFLAVFIDMTNASGGVAREQIDGNLRLVAQKNASSADIEVSQNTPCVSADGVQFSIYDCNSCTKSQQNIGTIFIPLDYDGKSLGAFALFFKNEPSLAYDERILIQTIADNIALYLDKINQQNVAKNMEIAKEKLYISQEIHDSLAQTIYSMNLQISVLEGLVEGKNQPLLVKINDLQNNVKQANAELRDLIDNFREPSTVRDNQSLVREIVDKFATDSGIKTYTQIDEITLGVEVQKQIVRIISEALANIKKHSGAKNVRLVYNNKQLLIEDDGKGFIINDKNDGHIGIKVMHERAERIGAKLYIESEADEGVLLILNYENLKL